MSLTNDGGFVARIQFSYFGDDGSKQLTKQSDDITLGVTKTVDPGDFGVPDGSICAMHVFVVWGTDHEANQFYLYTKGNASVANYVITGTTLSNQLGLTGTS